MKGKARIKRKESASERTALYGEGWDLLRKQVYKRDNNRCVMCGKKGKLHAHHIVPIRVSHDNSLSNLVSVCAKCHKILETVGFKILQEGGSRVKVKQTELKMINEAKVKRRKEYAEKKKELISDRERDKIVIPNNVDNAKENTNTRQEIE